MYNLLRANFYKLIKEKTIFVFGIIAACVSLMNIVMLIIMTNMNGISQYLVISGELLFLSGVSISQNLGVMIVLSISLYIGKEFSQNTLRNKIAVGYSKTKIYLANLIVAAAICLGFFFVYQILVFAIAVPILGWNDSFDFVYLLRQLLNSILIMLSFSSFICMVCMLTRSMVGGILLNLLCVIVISMALSALNLFSNPNNQVISTITKATFFGQSFLIATTNSISFMWWVVVSSLITIGGTTLLGCALFEKMDIK